MPTNSKPQPRFTPVSKNQIKLIRSLATTKGRRENGCFVAEGPKLVGELLATLPCRMLVACDGTLPFPLDSLPAPGMLLSASRDDMQRMSAQQAPQGVLGVFGIPQHELPAWDVENMDGDELAIALDGVQDPGNVGTILRLADWFGITHVVCSPSCASAYSPKTVQACMGALARVKVHTADLPEWLDSLPKGTPVYGTFLDGKSLYRQELTRHGVIVMGNEGQGISEAVEQRVTHKLLIPNYPAGRATTESLNVATATAIVCAEFRRNL